MNAELGIVEKFQQETMRLGQWYVVAICICILALDGYDVMSIAFAAPGITAEWGISKATLGVILSLELVGMAVGSILLGGFADSRGRRPTMLLGLFILTGGMIFAGLAPNIYVLGAARIFTGIGIGGLLATVAATSSDFCNDKNRSLAVTLVAGGFAFGIYLGATFLAPLLKLYDWRVTFYLGAFLSFIFIPITYYFVPETISYLERKRPKGALERIQKIMRDLGHPVPEEMPARTEQKNDSVGISSLFKSGMMPITLILIFAYLANIGTYYYFVKWIPTIVTDLGYTASQATQVLGVISLGGVLGSIGMSIITRFVPIRSLVFICLICAAIGVGLFPKFMDSLESMKQIGFITGAFIFAAISSFFGLFSASFPSSLLGSGSGVVLGFGRGGAILGPIIPGLLFTAGLALESVALIMAAGSFVAGILILFLRNQKREIS